MWRQVGQHHLEALPHPFDVEPSYLLVWQAFWMGLRRCCLAGVFPVHSARSAARHRPAARGNSRGESHARRPAAAALLLPGAEQRTRQRALQHAHHGTRHPVRGRRGRGGRQEEEPTRAQPPPSPARLLAHHRSGDRRQGKGKAGPFSFVTSERSHFISFTCLCVGTSLPLSVWPFWISLHTCVFIRRAMLWSWLKGVPTCPDTHLPLPLISLVPVPMTSRWDPRTCTPILPSHSLLCRYGEHVFECTLISSESVYIWSQYISLWISDSQFWFECVILTVVLYEHG